jgi:hypothetical protein
VLAFNSYTNSSTVVRVAFILEWSGINALLYYGPSLIQSIGFAGDSAVLLGSGFINIVQFIAVIPTILYIDKLGTSRAVSSHFFLQADKSVPGRKPLLIGTKDILRRRLNGQSHIRISLTSGTFIYRWCRCHGKLSCPYCIPGLPYLKHLF